MTLRIALGMALLGVADARAGCVTDPGGIVINEFLPDPTGADGTVLAEWVELHNAGSSAVDITGWDVQKATVGSSYSTEVTMPMNTSIPAGGFLVIGEQNVGFANVFVSGTMALGSGSGGDGVRLRDCTGAVADTVVYGDSDNEQAVIDDSGLAATSVAPKPRADETVARRANGVDTDQSGDDFWVPLSATPGASNPTPPVCVASDGDDIKVNEFVANPAGADADAQEEFVELFNTSSRTLSLGGWRIQTASSGTNWSTKVTLPGSASVSSDGYFVVGEANVSGRDFTPPAALSLGSGSHGDGVRLIDCDGLVVDTVIYGEDNTDAVPDDLGGTSSFAGKPGDDEAIARVVDGLDTDACGVDFFLTDVQTPGARNPGAPTCERSPDIVINELLANPSGSDSEVQLEWIELYNGGDSDVYVDNWTLRVASQADSFSVKATMPADTLIEADGYLLVGEAMVPGRDVTTGTIGMGSGLRGDGVRLVDCDGTRRDTVVFGDASNEDAVVDDTGSAATSVAPTPSDDVSLARRQDGLDTNASGDDFVPSSAPTPGAPNPLFECFPSTGDVLLNEVLPDPSGSDGEVGLEWVELFNRSGDVNRIDGWQLVFASNEDDVAADVLLPPESAIGALDFFVVGAANVEEADVHVPMSIGNGSGADAVRLIDCEGTLVDIVVYGEANEDGLLDESGSLAASAGEPGSDESLARVEDGADADDPNDWQVDRSPSPGATNVTVVDTDVDTGDRSGCKNNAPDGGAPGGGCGSDRPPSSERGCVTLLPLGGAEVLFAGLLALARRRR